MASSACRPFSTDRTSSSMCALKTMRQKSKFGLRSRAAWALRHMFSIAKSVLRPHAQKLRFARWLGVTSRT